MKDLAAYYYRQCPFPAREGIVQYSILRVVLRFDHGEELELIGILG